MALTDVSEIMTRMDSAIGLNTSLAPIPPITNLTCDSHYCGLSRARLASNGLVALTGNSSNAVSPLTASGRVLRRTNQQRASTLKRFEVTRWSSTASAQQRTNAGVE